MFFITLIIKARDFDSALFCLKPFVIEYNIPGVILKTNGLTKGDKFMGRRLFCEISPTTYKISTVKRRLQRRLRDMLSGNRFSSERSDELLPYVICRYNSLIRRKLGNVDMELQENKAVNLSIAAPKIDKILIKPNEVFSFWHLVGNTSADKGYKMGLMIAKGVPARRDRRRNVPVYKPSSLDGSPFRSDCL